MTSTSEQLAAALRFMVAEYCDYMQLNHLGNAEEQHGIKMARSALAAHDAQPTKLWLWKNFVDGRPEYWAFDNPFPVHMDCGDPQTLGEPCGYAIFKLSRHGRTDVSEAEVLRRIANST